MTLADERAYSKAADVVADAKVGAEEEKFLFLDCSLGNGYGSIWQV